MTKRWGESGNIFFTLFGAVALVGVVGAATSTLMRGPVGTVVSLNQRAKADSQMQIAMKLAMLEAQQRTTPSFPDCDADTLIEPVPPVDPGASDHPTGGGFLPSVGSTQNDPWGIRYGYCSWDHGGVIGSGCATPVGHVAPLNGSPSANGVVIAIISAGPNRVFDSNCSSDPTYITRDPGSDDIITEMTYAEANEASGGLWHIKSGDPNSITTGKALDVQQGAQFSSGNVDFSGSTITGDSQYGAGASLDLSSGGLFMLPDETILPDSECNDPTDAPNSGILRRDTAGGTKEALQMCDAFTDPMNPAWVNIGGSGGSVSAAGGEDEIQFNTGGVMDADPNLTWDGTTLDVTGAGSFSTDVTIGDELDVTGATTIDDTLHVTGNVQFDSNLDVDGPTDIDDVLNVTGNVDFGANFNADGNSTLGGTLGVTGDASFTAQVLGSAGSAAAPSYAFSGSSSSGIYYSSGGLGFSVGGTNEMTLSSSGLEVSALSVLGNISADRFISDMSTTSAALPGFETEPGTGLFSPVDNTLSLVAGGLQRITIDGTGDVGIGVSNPDAMLDVGGEIKVGTSAVPCGATLHGAIRYVSGDLLQVCSSTTNNWESIGTSGGGGSGASDYWTRISVADPRLYYTDDFVGVGTNDPLATFHVNGDFLNTGSFTGTASVPVSGAGTRMFFDAESGSFRAGHVLGTEWDNAQIGDYSAAFGYGTWATGDVSTAFGHGTTAGGYASFALGQAVGVTGDRSVGFGLGVPGGGPVSVSGQRSYGIFMNNMTGIDLQANDTMALLGGKFIIDQTPAANPAVSGTLSLDVEGGMGAMQYCDEDGNYCFTAASVAGGGIGAPGNDREIIYNSGGVLGTNVNFVFTSAGRMGVGTNAPVSDLDVRGTSGISHVNTSGYSVVGSYGVGDGVISSTMALSDLTTNRSWALSHSQLFPNDLMFTYADGLGGVFPHLFMKNDGRVLFGSTGTVHGALTVDIDGQMGATEYCDNFGLNCFTAADVATGDLAYGPDGTIQFASNGQLWGNPNYSWIDATSTLNVTGDAVITGSLDLTGNGAMTMPRGDTLQRPGSAVDGMIRYNSESGKFEGYQAGTWQDILTSAVAGGAAAPNRGIQFNSGNNFSADANFVYSSAGFLGLGTGTPQAELDVAGTGAMIPPRGSTGDRPASPVNGMIRYNSQTNKFEGYQSGAWADILTGNITSTFLALTDTPSSYASEAGKFVRVNAGENALEFTDEIVPSYSGQPAPLAMALDDLSDVNATTPNGNDIIRYNSVSGEWETVPMSSLVVNAAAPDRGIQFNDGGSFAATSNLIYTSTGYFNVGGGGGLVSMGTPSTYGIVSVTGPTGAITIDSWGSRGPLVDAYSQTTSNGGQFYSAGLAVRYPNSLGAENGVFFGDGGISNAASAGISGYDGDGGNNGIGGLRFRTNPTGGSAPIVRMQIDPQGLISFTSSGALVLNAGNTAQRPGVAVNGMLRYNSQTGKFEGYQSGAWADILTGNVSSTFLALTDTPASYAGETGKFVRVNAGETALEFTDEIVPSMSGQPAPSGLRLGWLDDVSATSPNGGDIIRFNSSNNKWESVALSTMSLTAAAPSRGIQFNSGGSFGADANFVFTATGRLGLGTSVPDADFDIATTGSMLMPRGDTAQRPGTPVNGMLRYNSQTGKFEGYQAGAWQDIVTGAAGGSASAPDRGVQFNSGGSFAADSSFTYSSTGYLGLGTANPVSELDIAGTGAVALARGDTSQRPGTAVNGMIRYNSQTGKFEGYQSGAWADILTGNVSSTFLALTDTPASYAGETGKFVRVNAGETALEFTDEVVAVVTGQPAPNGLRLDGLDDVSATSPNGGDIIRFNSSTNLWESVQLATMSLTAAAPSRGIQFNSGGSFAADANFVYTATGRMGLGTSNPAADFDIGTTGSMLMPRGDTAQRPGTPVNGMIRYNSQTGKFEGYQAGAWADILTGNVNTTFLALTDTPASYTGEGGKYVRVNSGATGLEFTDELIPSVSGGAAPADTVLTDLGDVTITSPTAGQTLYYSGGQWINSAATGGSGTPAGSNTHIQFNSGGAFAASSNMVYTSAGLLTLQATTATADVMQLNNNVGQRVGRFESESGNGRLHIYDSTGVQRILLGTNQGTSSPYIGAWTGNKTDNTFYGAGLALRVANALNNENGVFMGDSSAGNWAELASAAVTYYDTNGGFYGRGGLRFKTNAGGSLVTRMQIDQNGLISFTSTGALVLNTGDTSQRPAVPVNGMIRYNSQTGKFEGYQAGAWADILTGNVNTTFLALTDTPASYAGSGGMFVKVNSGATALEFTNNLVNSVSGQPAPTGLMLDNIDDVTISSPTAGQTLFYSGGEWVNGTASGGGTPATPDRGIQFNSGGAFAADSNFVYTSKGYLGLGTASPAGTLHVDGGTSTTGAGADITLTAQRAVAAGGLGGDVFITAGAGESWGDGGNITLSAGRGNASTGMGGYGGSLTLNGGFAPGSPGVAILKGGNAANGFGSGGIITLNSTGSTSGGSVTIVGGNGNSVPGDGGNILIDGGLKSGAGIDGNVILGSVRGNVGIGTVSPLAQLDVGGTGSMLMPRGDTSQRPGTPVNGMIRYNSQTGKFEGYQAGAWADILTGNVNTTFLALTDTPASYAGAGGMFVKVNSGATALEFSNQVVNSVSGAPAPTGLLLDHIGDVTITSPTAGQTLYYSGGQWINGAGGGGGGTPAGANTEVQFNSAGAFGSSANFAWNNSANVLTVNKTIRSTSDELIMEQTGDAFGASRLRLQNRNGMNGAVFENPALDLVDFSFLTSTSKQLNLRIEGRNAYTEAGNDVEGEFQFVDPSGPTIYAQIGAARARIASPIVTLAGTGSLQVPKGNTSQRPASPVNGMIRYNSQNDKFEGYQSGSWQDIVTGSVTGTFAALTDTPASYAGSAGYFVKVNVGESGLTFSSNLINNVSGQPAPVGLGLVDLDDVNISSPSAGQTLVYSGGQWVNSAPGGGAPGSPDRGIQFNSGGSFMADAMLTYTSVGDFIVGSSQINDTGSATGDYRLYFDVSKGSFRAGRMTGTEADEVNAGLYSGAIGYNNRASGLSSFAAGNSNIASGSSALALGNGNTASDNYDIAIGNGNTTAGGLPEGIAIGAGNTSSENGSVAIGRNNTASGYASVAMGSAAFATGSESFAVGEQPTASGDDSIALGYMSTASGISSIAIGQEVKAIATNTMAIGLGNQTGVDANRPQVSGINSLGIFMGAQTSVNLASTNTMGLFGGKFVIDPNVPATQLSARSVLDLGAATDSIVVPRGDTSQRPATPANGMIRYNSQTAKFEGYQSGAWADILTGNVTTNFLALTDTPSSFSGEGGKYVRVNSGATALEFTDQLIPTVTGGAAPATMVIDDMGDVTITSPTAGQTLFYSGGQWVNGAAGGGAPAGANTQIQFNSGGSFGGSGNLTWDGTTFAVTGDITYSGTITDVSDRRLKTDIIQLDDRGSMLEKIGMIDTYSFRMKNNPEAGVEFGVMAQDIQKIFPELVRTDKSTPENYLSVNYVGMIAPMIEATKELKAENETLKAELAAIKADRETMVTALNDLSRDVKGLKAHTGYGVDKAGFEFWMMIMAAVIIGASATLLVIGSMRQSRKRG